MTVRLGPYETLDELGRGGMGRVLRARHLPTGATRAIKVLEGADPEAVARFRRELETLARAGGDGVVAIHDSGRDGARFWFAMDLHERGSLRALLRARGRLEWREAAAIIGTLARTLERCHALGIVHRDVKPENVLFDDAGRPLLSDFGLARVVAGASLTATGTVVGTPGYMSPEQMEGGADAAADVWALGAMLHEAVSGELPFARPTPAAYALAIRARVRQPLEPAELETLVARLLEPDRTRRFSTPGQLARSLDALLEGRARGGGGRALALAFGAVAVAAIAAAVALAEKDKPPVRSQPSPFDAALARLASGSGDDPTRKLVAERLDRDPAALAALGSAIDASPASVELRRLRLEALVARRRPARDLDALSVAGGLDERGAESLAERLWTSGVEGPRAAEAARALAAKGGKKARSLLALVLVRTGDPAVADEAAAAARDGEAGSDLRAAFLAVDEVAKALDEGSPGALDRAISSLVLPAQARDPASARVVLEPLRRAARAAARRANVKGVGAVERFGLGSARRLIARIEKLGGSVPTNLGAAIVATVPVPGVSEDPIPWTQDELARNEAAARAIAESDRILASVVLLGIAQHRHGKFALLPVGASEGGRIYREARVLYEEVRSLTDFEATVAREDRAWLGRQLELAYTKSAELEWAAFLRSADRAERARLVEAALELRRGALRAVERFTPDDSSRLETHARDIVKALLTLGRNDELSGPRAAPELGLVSTVEREVVQIELARRARRDDEARAAAERLADGQPAGGARDRATLILALLAARRGDSAEVIRLRRRIGDGFDRAALELGLRADETRDLLDAAERR